jgi:cell division protein ZapA (FtsZ GTPase activity inhibitor)
MIHGREMEMIGKSEHDHISQAAAEVNASFKVLIFQNFDIV